MSERKRQQALALVKDPSIFISEICKTLGVSRSTFYRSVSGKEAQTT